MRPIAHLITSEDLFIADARGAMPEALRHAEDWNHFQAQLDRAALTVLGRRTHEAAPNQKHRRRLVISRRTGGLVQEDEVTWWCNPSGVPLAQALLELIELGDEVAIAGGQAVYDLALRRLKLAEVHHTLAHGVRLGGGTAALPDCPDLDAFEARLTGAGLALTERRWLHKRKRLELRVWSRPSREAG